VLHGEESGAGLTMLLLHAGGERRQVWKPVVDVLVQSGFRCVAYDQRGHGESGGTATALRPCADDIAAMIAAEPPQCVVVGASLGGLAAIAALADPAVRSRVAGLVLVDVVPDLEPDRVRRFLAAGGLLDSRTRIVEDILGRVPELREIFAQLDLPVLLVRGGDRSVLTDTDVDHLLQTSPDAVTRDIPGSGHLVARDRPVPLAEAIAEVTVSWVSSSPTRSM
jgi:pimeloyl-ACP methyl ester carboxylesterase